MFLRLIVLFYQKTTSYSGIRAILKPPPTQHTMLQLDTSVELGPSATVFSRGRLSTWISCCFLPPSDADHFVMTVVIQTAKGTVFGGDVHLPQRNGEDTLKPGSRGSTASSKLTAELSVFETVAWCGVSCVCVCVCAYQIVKMVPAFTHSSLLCFEEVLCRFCLCLREHSDGVCTCM